MALVAHFEQGRGISRRRRPHERKQMGVVVGVKICHLVFRVRAASADGYPMY